MLQSHRAVSWLGLDNRGGGKSNQAVIRFSGERVNHSHDARAKIQAIGAVREHGAALDPTEAVAAPIGVAAGLSGGGPTEQRHRWREGCASGPVSEVGSDAAVGLKAAVDNQVCRTIADESVVASDRED